MIPSCCRLATSSNDRSIRPLAQREHALTRRGRERAGLVGMGSITVPMVFPRVGQRSITAPSQRALLALSAHRESVGLAVALQVILASRAYALAAAASRSRAAS